VIGIRKSYKIMLSFVAILVFFNMMVLPQYVTGATSDTEWPMFRYDPQHSGHSTTSAPITNPVLWSYTTGDCVDSSPAVVDGKVYVGSEDFNVYCLDAASGSLIWSYMTGHVVLSSPAVANGRVYVGSLDEIVYCFGSIPPAAVTASVNDVTVMKKRLNLAWTRSTDPQSLNMKSLDLCPVAF
jgi:hypothetical protein